jgi:hypothetical protein
VPGDHPGRSAAARGEWTITIGQVRVVPARLRVAQ